MERTEWHRHEVTFGKPDDRRRITIGWTGETDNPEAITLHMYTECATSDHLREIAMICTAAAELLDDLGGVVS